MLKLETNGGARILITQRTRPCEKIVEDLRRRGIRGKSTYTFEALPEGTRVTLEFDAKAKGFYKLLHPFIGAYLRKQLQELVLGPMKQAAEGLAASNTSRQELVVGSHGLDASSSLNRYFDSAEATNGLTRTRDQGIEIPRT